MQTDSLLAVRIIFSILFFGALVAGVFLFKNYEKLFGVDPNMPSENSSSRAYRKVQIFVIWAHVVGLTGAFALLLH
ncbi:MAG: hypothetical protein QOE70_3749 [Chthoniobacter sp.]|jgi:hypothetical protein|nr:hypothetical protein [Chthoniobacter sp.]